MKYQKIIPNSTPFGLFFTFWVNSFLVLIFAKSEYTYIGFLANFNTHSFIFCKKVIFVFLRFNQVYLKEYKKIILKSDKIISVTSVKLKRYF